MKDDLTKEIEQYYHNKDEQYYDNNEDEQYYNNEEDEQSHNNYLILGLLAFSILVVIGLSYIMIKENIDSKNDKLYTETTILNKTNSSVHNSKPPLDYDNTHEFDTVVYYENLDPTKTYTISYSFVYTDEDNHTTEEESIHTVDFTPKTRDGYVDSNGYVDIVVDLPFKTDKEILDNNFNLFYSVKEKTNDLYLIYKDPVLFRKED